MPSMNDHCRECALLRQKLSAAEARFHNVIEKNADGIVIVDRSGIVRFHNPAAARMFNCSESGLIGKIFGFPVVANEHADLDILCQRKPVSVEMRVVEIEWEDEVMFLASLRDITARKQIELQLRQQSTWLKFISDAVIATDLNLIINSWNEAAEKIYGWSEKEAIGCEIDMLLKTEFIDTTRAEAQKTLEQTGFWRGRICQQTKIGEKRYFDASVTFLKEDSGEAIGGITVNRDITDHKVVEDRLKASLQEKEVLLREIHHRVKNNLEVIISLIEMQSACVPDKSLLHFFNEIRERIWVIARVHEDLYHSDNLSNINFRNYLENLSNDMFSLYDAPNIRIRTDFSEAYLDIETAIPCGLIFIELLTNALKHAFPKDRIRSREYEIRCGFISESDMFILIVSDNGIGMPENFDWRTAKTMGLRLVNILAKQLDGRLDLSTCNGTAFELSFPKPKTRN